MIHAPIRAAQIWLMTRKMKGFYMKPWPLAWRLANDNAHCKMVYYKD